MRLSLGPNHINTNGIGIIITPIHPMRVPAQFTPRFVNNCLENNGKVAPTAERRIVLAAKTEAALWEYVSLYRIEQFELKVY